MKFNRPFLARLLGSLLLAASSLWAEEYNLYQFDESMTIEDVEQLEKGNGGENAEETLAKPYVIMVSLDGFRHDYVELHGAKNLQEMKESGSFVSRLIPSFPSKTFPNHYTIATGMYPAHHGLVGNSFYSRTRKAEYRLGNRDAVEDGDWYGGTPLWVLAEKQGMRSASFFWVGSEADVQGIHPSSHFQYQKTLPYPLRIEKVKRWLEEPASTRPHLIMLYFSLTDTAGHVYGPEAPETGKAVRHVDELIGQLRDYVRASELPVNLIVTADHGMSLVDGYVNVRDFVDLKGARFVSGPMAMIYTDSESETDRIFAELQGQEKFECYREGTLPSYLNFSNSDRIGDIVLVAQAPDQLGYFDVEMAWSSGTKATHGFDPYRNDEMGAIFIAEGPSIQSGLELSPVENIHIYPLVASILGLEVPDNIDGRSEVLAPLLKK
ncbi:alkaline phosphatase family protein [Pelagicoccus albus]|uniref:Alkaline phosphatase family protein n=1 Tax=Pelagicoccus albus TaxID=415222 RepID=A0A7X1E7E9_9BACT|nr:ectonucleotide pyrophosphatase/phosphodiesterase [Pelagicoccus albus]MBC2605209.1 alkaline phosphatase family protein [Pelagicoccus albus]